MQADALLTRIDHVPTPVEVAAMVATMKPGSHGLVGVTLDLSTRVALALEDGGFEIRDRLTHLVAPGRLRLDWWLLRKPLAGSVADTIRAHGVGALNIDGCRVATAGETNPSILRRETARRTGVTPTQRVETKVANAQGQIANRVSPERYMEDHAGEHLGRWPANVVLGHGPGCVAEGCAPGCPVLALNEQSGDRPSTLGGRADPGQAHGHPSSAQTDSWFSSGLAKGSQVYADDGGAARYFHAFPVDDDVALLTYLIKLILPPGGRVFDPFGDPTVGKALQALGYGSRPASAPDGAS